MGGALTAIDAFQQGNSASKASVKVGASVVAGGAGYVLVNFGLAAVGVTPVGWVGAIGVVGLSTILGLQIDSQFEATIDRYMD